MLNKTVTLHTLGVREVRGEGHTVVGVVDTHLPLLHVAADHDEPGGSPRNSQTVVLTEIKGRLRLVVLWLNTTVKWLNLASNCD